MRILLLNCVYRNGSTGKILADTRSFLIESDVNTYVGYGNFESKEVGNIEKFGLKWETKLYSILSKLGYPQYASSPLSTYRLIKYIKKVRPDVVHLHCLNGYCVNVFQLLKYLSRKHIKTVVTHHAEFYYTGNCEHAYECDRFYTQECQYCIRPRYATKSRTMICTSHFSWKQMKRAFSEFDRQDLIFTAVSPWVKQRSMLSPIVNTFPCIVVMNGLDTSVFYRRQKKALEIVEIKKLGFLNVVLHVTAAFLPNDKEHIKGGYYVVELAKSMPTVAFVIIASYSNVDVELPANVFVVGSMADQNMLAEYYSSCDVTLLTSKKETFSMITAESLCCGTPVVGFKAGGPESITLENYSFFANYGDLESLKDYLLTALSKKYVREDIAKEAHKKYAKEVMAQGYLELYKNLLCNETK